MCNKEELNLNIVEVNNTTVVVEGVYNISKRQLQQFRDKKELIKELAKYKQQFLNSDTIVEKLTVLNSFWVDVFLHLESIKQCDLALCSFQEILDFFIFLKDNDKITSNSMFLAYARIINIYTMWAYNENLRVDIVSVGDITREIDRNTVTKDKTVYTRNEIVNIAKNCEKMDVKITILALLEGIKISEITKIKRLDDLLNNPDDILVLGNRIVPVSPYLMNLMREYAETIEIETIKSNGKNVIRELVNTDYLIRSVNWGRAVIGRDITVSNTTLVNTVNKTILKDGITTVDIRNYAMYNDIIDGISLEDFNIKYDTKYRTLNQAVRDRKAFNKLINKRIEEGSYKEKCS